MSGWQLIETAPKDGTRILLSNHRFFAAGARAWHVESDMVPEFPLSSPLRYIPNPKAGQRTEWWHTDPPSAYLEADVQYPDYDGNFDSWEPTHWMPLFAAPQSGEDAA